MIDYFEKQQRIDGMRARAAFVRAPRALTSTCGCYQARLEAPERRSRPALRQLGWRWAVTRTRDGREVGALHEGSAYGYGRISASLCLLRSQGPCPVGYPKNPDAVLAHDLGPHDSAQAALDAFAERASKLEAWRERHAKEDPHG